MKIANLHTCPSSAPAKNNLADVKRVPLTPPKVDLISFYTLNVVICISRKLKKEYAHCHKNWNDPLDMYLSEGVLSK